MFFLRALKAELAARGAAPCRLTLFEGFLTFKATGTNHERDAQLLLEAFLAGGEELSDLPITAGATAICVLDVIASAPEERHLPALVIPAEARVEAH